MTVCPQCGADLPDQARFCPACGASIEAAPPVAEERKLATVLFADLVSSTELGASQDPERTRALLERFYDAMAAEVAGAGGTVEKFAGDAVMAVFGAPAAQEDHAERALHCALSMQRRLSEGFAGQLSLRIGVNTGDVIVGRPREGSSFVTGDPVNVAARLEQAAAPGEILAGERTVAAARGAFEFADPTTVEAKGKPGGVAARRLVRALSLMRPRGVGGLARAFVGRESELELLGATYRRVASEQRPHVVTIIGDSGVGKTRLVRELWEWLAVQAPEPLRRTGRCLPYGDGITYWPLGEVLKEHLGLLESDSPETALERLENRRILGLTMGLDVAGDLHPLRAREQLHEAWVEFLAELARGQPVVVLAEDLHWAEDELLDLLERLAREVDGPLLLIGTARPELVDRRSSWGAGTRNASLLWLEPLSVEQTDHMVEELLSAELPAPVHDVLKRAEGNPFFVEELVATLIDRGILTRSEGTWTVGELPEEFAVPDSVQAALAARIDLLAPNEKAALQAASVIGRIFWTGPVRELIGDAEPDFDILEERDFIRHRSGSSIVGEREYAIKHALTREVAYGSVPKARRARMHARFAEWVERVGEGRDEQAPLLAHHFAEAVRPEDADLAWGDEPDDLARLRDKAIDWLRRSARLAIGRYEIGEAVQLLERAAELEPTREGQTELWRLIGDANALRFAGEEFVAAMQRALEFTDDGDTRADIYGELAFQSVSRAGMWRRRPQRELLQSWIDEGLRHSDEGSAARVKALISRGMLDRDAQGLDAAIEASRRAEQLGDLELRSYSWDARSLCAFSQGNFEEALMWEQRRADLRDEIGDPDHLSDLTMSTIPPCVMLGRFREARRLAQECDDVSQGLSAHHELHGIAVQLEVEEVVGAWERIRELEPVTEARVAANLDTPCLRNARSLLVAAIAREVAGDSGQAREFERQADELGMEGYDAILAAPRLRLALLRGELDRLEPLLVESWEMRRQTWFSPATRAARLDALAALRAVEAVEEEVARLELGVYLGPFAERALGVVRGDEELIRKALEQFEAMKLDWHAAETRKLLTA